MAEQGNIYIVTINGQKRKAIDLEALKIFIEQKKYKASLLNMDLDSLDFDDSIYKHIATHAVETLTEIEATCDEALGLNKVEEPIHEDEDEPEMSDDILPTDLEEVANEEADKIIDIEDSSDEDDSDHIIL